MPRPHVACPMSFRFLFFLRFWTFLSHLTTLPLTYLNRSCPPGLPILFSPVLSMLNSDRASPYLLPTTHRHTQLQLQQHQQSRIQHLVQVPRKPPFAFHSSSLDLTAQIMDPSHPFHLNLSDNILCTTTTPSRAASSCQSLPAEVSFHPYPPMGDKSDRCSGMPHQNPTMNPWPLSTGTGRPPAIMTGRPWQGATGLTPEVFLPGGDAQPYNSYLLELSPNSEAFNPAAPPAVATPIMAADAARPHDQPQDLAVYLSGSESDSGQEPEDERNIVRDARQDQWMSISAASPRAKSPATASSRRSASFLASEVPSAYLCSSNRFVLLVPPQETKLGSSLLPKDMECSARTTRRARSSSRKPKMHQCQTCKKWFPRPSGLATHMNVHSGAKRE